MSVTSPGSLEEEADSSTVVIQLRPQVVPGFSTSWHSDFPQDHRIPRMRAQGVAMVHSAWDDLRDKNAKSCVRGPACDFRDPRGICHRPVVPALNHDHGGTGAHDRLDGDTSGRKWAPHPPRTVLAPVPSLGRNRLQDRPRPQPVPARSSSRDFRSACKTIHSGFCTRFDSSTGPWRRSLISVCQPGMKPAVV